MDTIIEEYMNIGFISTHLHVLKDQKHKKKSKYDFSGKDTAKLNLNDLLGTGGTLRGKIVQQT
jgi:hypothetical protein